MRNRYCRHFVWTVLLQDILDILMIRSLDELNPELVSSPSAPVPAFVVCAHTGKTIPDKAIDRKMCFIVESYLTKQHTCSVICLGM